MSSPPNPPAPAWLFWSATPSRAIAIAFVVSVLLAAGAVVLNGLGPIGWHAAVRITAVIAFPIWLLAFSAGALARRFPTATTRALRARRRALGLAYATAQYVHFTAIVMLARIEPEVLDETATVVGGGFGFLMIALMAATSNDAAVKRLGGRSWKRLHGLGQLTLAIVYLVTYGGRVAEDLAYWPGLAILLAAIALRAADSVQLRLRSTTEPTE